MSFTAAAVLAAEAGSESEINPWLVGVAVLVVFVLLLLGLFTFGKGRQHS
ncbi:signaling repeat-containing protein [Mumia flava]|uniref:Signaling repeat-containing protein n=1 Tax=Mumia flava TaxID=1348852 RepID=A0A2M9B7U5_9ACTN|nr:MHYT domain-containing protein [Mumia flava]PJJ53991.1 signaling repeat-containing protein [Mumia flava]